MSHQEPHAPTRDELTSLMSRGLPKSLKTLALVLLVLGAVAFLFGVFTGERRAWQALHFNWLFFTTISSAGVAFAAVQRITTARWSRPIVRLIEGFVAWLPIAFVLLLLTVLFGKSAIFPWVTEHPTVPEKAFYLEPTFFTIRAILAFGIITLLSVWFVYTSLRLDVALLPEWGAAWARGLRARMRNGFGEERREIHDTHSLQGRLAVFLVLAFGLLWMVLSWDLSMSLDVHFQSTMYGWQFFMGGWVAALMAFSILIRVWRNYMDAYEVITEKHFHDVGKLCFAFSAFWGYLTFGQYLVIWYGNLAEETHFFRLRLIEPWKALTVAVGALMFVVPFFTLLSKTAKTFTPIMTVVALCSIVGLWIHRYVEIYPSIYAVAPSVPFGIWELAISLGFLGAWGFAYMAFMDAFPRFRVTLMTSPYRDEVQVPYDPETMEPLPAHE